MEHIVDLLEAMSKLMQLTGQDLRIVSAIMTTFIERYPAAAAAVPVVPVPATVPLPVPVPPPPPPQNHNHPQLHQNQEINHGDTKVLNQDAQNEPVDVDVDVKPDVDVEMVVVVPEPVPRPIPEPKRSRTKPKTIGMIKYSNRYPPDVKRHAIRLRDKGKSFSKIINKIGRLYPKYGFPSIGSVQQWIKERARWLDSNAVNVNDNDTVAAASAAGSNEGDSALPRKTEDETENHHDQLLI